MNGQAKKGKSSIIFVLALLALLVFLFDFPLPKLIEENLGSIGISFEEGLEIIKSKSNRVCSNVRWTEIQAAGIKVTETSLKGFIQICERLVLDLGNLQVYADVEARVMWIYSNPSEKATDTQVHYIKFP